MWFYLNFTCPTTKHANPRMVSCYGDEDMLGKVKCDRRHTLCYRCGDGCVRMWRSLRAEVYPLSAVLRCINAIYFSGCWALLVESYIFMVEPHSNGGRFHEEQKCRSDKHCDCAD